MRNEEKKFTPGPWGVCLTDGKYFPHVHIGPRVVPTAEFTKKYPQHSECIRYNEIIINDGPSPESLAKFLKTGSTDNLIGTTMETCNANALLIAAAPDLYAAVKLAYEFFISPSKFNPVEVERAYEAAIRKADQGK
jgi:hypothetical protein